MALGVAIGNAALSLAAPEPAPFTPPERAGSAPETRVQTAALEAAWPAIFGVEAAPEPEPEPLPEPEPEPEAAADPVPEPDPEPEIRYDYLLTGFVTDGPRSWALLSLGGMQQIVQVGDELEGTEIVTKIDDRGVWVTWRGLPQLIPVNRTDTSLFARDVTAPEDAAPPQPGGEYDVILERLDRHGLEETFQSAGRLVLTELDGGKSGLDVVWIRQGELYDRIGLRTGDKILRVNGSVVETADMLAYLPDAMTQGGTIDLEILREGTRQIIKVNLGQG